MSLTDIAEVRAALEEMARQRPTTEMTFEEVEAGCFIDGYNEFVTKARQALTALTRMERSAAREGRRWRHVTSGMTVAEIGRGRMQTAEPIGDMTPIVIYHHAGEHGGGTYWVRPVREFEDGRFVEPPPPACEHDFGGWREHADGRGGEQFCRKCGMGAMENTLRNDPT